MPSPSRPSPTAGGGQRQQGGGKKRPAQEEEQEQEQEQEQHELASAAETTTTTTTTTTEEQQKKSKAAAAQQWSQLFAAAARNSLAASSAAQEYDVLLVLELQSTCAEERGSINPQETIEMGIVAVELKAAAAAAKPTTKPTTTPSPPRRLPRLLPNARFHTYVKPTEHPRLTDFCVGLTGVRQEQVDAAPLLADALGGARPLDCDPRGDAAPPPPARGQLDVV
jgi:hypothetical protein